ncbi:MAG: 3'(2'),5'-bisphosphate nucleotidase CysQ [Alphaproteobacteria bacterium]
MIDCAALLPEIDAAARRAGDAILAIYRTDFGVERKADESPVTQADLDAERIILDVLRRITPDIPAVAEEEVSAGRVPEVGDCFWLVDPLDGTREFLSRNGEFTVNIALIEDRRPILGVVHAPDRGLTFTGHASGHATRQEGGKPAERITVRKPPEAGLTVVASRRHGSIEEHEDFLRGRKVAGRIACGSSLKFCVVASGEADVYPRFGPTMEWDTAAGHAVLAAAGGCITTTDGKEFLYRKPGFENPDFIAWGGLR